MFDELKNKEIHDPEWMKRNEAKLRDYIKSNPIVPKKPLTGRIVGISAVAAVALIALIYINFSQNKTIPNVTVSPTESAVPSSSETPLVSESVSPSIFPTPEITQTPTPTPSKSPDTFLEFFENKYMQVRLNMGWIAKQDVDTPSAVTITKGNYILYIDAKTKQASGVGGGRFSEISMGMPSADGVVIDPPNICGSYETRTAMHDHPRIDLFVGPQDQQDWCAVPDSKTVWYFSYIASGSYGNHFNYYGTGEYAYVITMSYNSKDVNKLPIKGSYSLNVALDEMTTMAKTLVIK